MKRDWLNQMKKKTREKWTEKNWVRKKEARRRELKLTQFWLLCQSNERSSLNGFLVNRKTIFCFSLFHLVYSSNNRLVITLQVVFSFAKLSKHDIKLNQLFHNEWIHKLFVQTKIKKQWKIVSKTTLTFLINCIEKLVPSEKQIMKIKC